MNRKGVILMRYPRGINSDIEELLDEAFNALTDGILISVSYTHLTLPTIYSV